jgi:hypothetical protein
VIHSLASDNHEMHHVWKIRALLLLGAVMAALTAPLAAQTARSVKAKRAKPPAWPQGVREVFFDDAREKLVGPRPEFAKSAVAVASSSAGAGPSGAAAAAADGSGWSRLISRESIEDEIKSLQKQLSADVTTASQFKGGGYKAARKELTELALMFALIAEYDGEVRWKDQAAGVRDLIARAGHNCKVGTDASYKEAKLRKDDLEQLVQGNNVKAPEADAAANWEKVADRQPLMQRLEQAQQQGIGVWTSNAGEFSKHADSLLHEAELIAAIAEVIQKTGFEFADDETYLGFAKQMRDQALEVISAVKGKNYDAARTASGQIDKACSSCHEGFRS